MKGTRPLRRFFVTVAIGQHNFVHTELDAFTPEAAIAEAKRTNPTWEWVRVRAEGRSFREWLVSRPIPEADCRLDLGPLEQGAKP